MTKKASSSELIYTFNSSDMKGSPQVLHFFQSQKKMERTALEYEVCEDIDHSFVFLRSRSQAQVCWKNRAGSIQFCGSGAYALAWFMLQQGQQDGLEIVSKSKKLHAFYRDQKVFLSIPPVAVQRQGGETLFYEKSSGIYFLQTPSPDILLDTEGLESYMHSLSEIHGFCAFHWKKGAGEGVLRYFTPWHGRDEDHVTGSVHQSLTPLIYQLFQERDQEWNQLSGLGGRLFSSFTRTGEVLLQGQCSHEIFSGKEPL